MKQKYLCTSQGRFMTKDLHKAFLKGSRLRNKFLSNMTEISQKEYTKQQNLYVNLSKRATKRTFCKS